MIARAAIALLLLAVCACAGALYLQDGRVQRMERAELARQARDRQELRLWEAQIAVNQRAVQAVGKLALRVRETDRARR